MHYHTNYFSVFFGNKINGLEAPSKRVTLEQEKACITGLTNAISHQMIHGDIQVLDANRLPLQLPIILLQQTHSVTIHELASYDHYSALALRAIEGDGLITGLPHTAIGVLTADCLPIIFYNHHNHKLAIIHAGWRGITQEIIHKTIDTLTSHDTNMDSYTIILGPAARGCCYQVGEEFVHHIAKSHFHSVQKRNNRLYFDLHTYAQQELAFHNIPASAIHVIPLCTICDVNFYSHRREGTTCTQRQVTVAVLHTRK